MNTCAVIPRLKFKGLFSPTVALDRLHFAEAACNSVYGMAPHDEYMEEPAEYDYDSMEDYY